MKRHQFRLATVLRLREIAERDAALELGAAHRRAAEARSDIDRHLGSAAALQPVSGTQPAAGFLAHRAAVEHATEAAVAADARLRAAEAEVDDRRKAWEMALSSLRAVERLRDRDRRAHRVQAARADVKAADDLTTSRYMRSVA